MLGKEATVGDARGPDPLGIHVEVGNHVVDEIGHEGHVVHPGLGRVGRTATIGQLLATPSG